MKDKTSGKSQTVRIEATTSLSKEEVERLKSEAAANAAEDKKKKEFVELKNQAENLVYVSEKALRDAGDKVPRDISSKITEKIDMLKKVKDGNDLASIQSAVNDLSSEIQKIGPSMQGGSSENK